MPDFKTFYFRHSAISFFRDIDVKGFRKLSILLPRILLPNPTRLKPYVLKTLYGFRLKIDPANDKGVELSLHETGTYEKGILFFLKGFLKKGDCFVDVGANIGLMSLFASQCVGDNGAVLSFEAHPETSELLNYNISLNKFKNIKVFDCALGSEKGEGVIRFQSELNRGGASLIDNFKREDGCKVLINTLDDLFPGNLIPKVIKIDVEGFEFEVLKGAEKIIKGYSPVLILELIDERSADNDNVFALIDYALSLSNYKVFKLKGGKERKSKLIEVKHKSELPSHDNVILIPA